MGVIKLSVSLRLLQDSLYSECIEPKKNAKELSDFIVSLLRVYYEDDEIRSMVDEKIDPVGAKLKAIKLQANKCERRIQDGMLMASAVKATLDFTESKLKRECEENAFDTGADVEFKDVAFDEIYHNGYNIDPLHKFNIMTVQRIADSSKVIEAIQDGNAFHDTTTEGALQPGVSIEDIVAKVVESILPRITEIAEKAIDTRMHSSSDKLDTVTSTTDCIKNGITSILDLSMKDTLQSTFESNHSVVLPSHNIVTSNDSDVIEHDALLKNSTSLGVDEYITVREEEGTKISSISGVQSTNQDIVGDYLSIGEKQPLIPVSTVADLVKSVITDSETGVTTTSPSSSSRPVRSSDVTNTTGVASAPVISGDEQSKVDSHKKASALFSSMMKSI